MNFIYLLLSFSVCSQTVFAAQQKNTHPRDEETQRSNQRRKIEAVTSQDETGDNSDSSSESFMSDEETNALAQQLFAERNSPTLFTSLQTNAVGNINAPAQNQNATTTSSSQPMQDIDEKSQSDNESQSSSEADNESQSSEESETEEERLYSALINAASKGDIPMIYMLRKVKNAPIETGEFQDQAEYEYVVYTDSDTWLDTTPLMAAATNGQVEAIKALVTLGANVNFEDSLGTALHRAVRHGQLGAIDALVKLGANLETVSDEFDCSPLILAADLGYTDAIELLVRLGAKIEARNREGFTPLGSAVNHLQVATVKELLDLAADINTQQGYYHIPLLRLVLYPEDLTNSKESLEKEIAAAQILVLLLKHGALPDPGFWEEIKERPYFLKAIEEYNKENIAIQQQVDLGMGKEAGTQHAASIITSYLHQPIINPNAKVKIEQEEKETEEKQAAAQTTTSTITPIPEQRELSEVEKEQKRVNYLLFNGIKRGATVADVNNWMNMNAQLGAQDAEGFTPLMLAILYNRNDIFDLLLGQISSQPHPRDYLDMTDNSGFTALSWALKRNKEDLFTKLLRAGASTSTNNNNTGNNNTGNNMDVS